MTDPDPDPDLYLMARIIKPDCIYTIEFRYKSVKVFPPRLEGWDRGIPHDGVVIHKERTLYHVGQKGWRTCMGCWAIAYTYDGESSGNCPIFGSHWYKAPPGHETFDFSLGLDNSGYPGQSGWRWCNQCQGLAFSPDASPSGLCQGTPGPIHGSHDFTGSGNYTLIVDDSTAIGQTDYRWCNQCQGLAFSPDGSPSGVCPSKDDLILGRRPHDFTGSGVYTLSNNDWGVREGKLDPNPFFVPSVLEDDPSGWDWRPYQVFRDEKRNIAVRVGSINVDKPHPTAKVTIGDSSLEPHRIREMELRRLAVALNSSGDLQVIVVASPRPDGTANDIWQKIESVRFPSGWSDWIPLEKPSDTGIKLGG